MERQLKFLSRVKELEGEGMKLGALETILWEQIEDELCFNTKRESCRRCADANCTFSPYRVDMSVRK